MSEQATSVPYRILIESTPPDGPTVRYRVDWEDAWKFSDEVLGRPPLPGAVMPQGMKTRSDDRIVATKFEMVGRGGGTTEGCPFTHAIFTVTYGVFPAQASGA